MAYSAITKPTDYFNTVKWTGTGDATTAVTGVGFQPDWVWIKNRDVGDDHMVFDAVRGTTKPIFTNSSNAESTNAESLQSFDTNGFTTGNHRGTGGDNGNPMVAWNWKANGSGSANTDGSINSTVSVNTTAGFSIVKWTGNNYGGATVGHGLGAVPKMIIFRNYSVTEDWTVYHQGLTSNNYKVDLNNNSAEANVTNPYLENTTPTNSLITLGDHQRVNGSGNSIIAYCFAEKKGFSKFGSYTGNGNANGTFIYTGFKPAWVMIKQVNTTGNWALSDNKRNNTGGGNFVSHTLAANLYQNESYFGGGAGNKQDYLSNGFKIRDTGGYANTSGGTYIYMAFAEESLVANVGQGIPATAR